jgi:hypothetical protein
MAKDRKNKDGPMEIADMDITFDDEGQIINVVKVEGDKLGEIVKLQKVKQQVNEEASVKPSEHMNSLRKMLTKKKNSVLEAKMNESDLSELQH